MSEPLLFNERVVVVTGAGRGIGRCYALELAARGASVVVADNGSGIDGSGGSADPARQVVDEIGAGSQLLPHRSGFLARPRGTRRVANTCNGGVNMNTTTLDMAASGPHRITLPQLAEAIQYRRVLVLRCLGVRITVSGGPIRNLRGVLVVSGHISWVDIFTIGAVMPGSFVAKAEVISWPGFGVLARLMKVIPIERDSLRRLPAVVDAVAARLRAGHTVVAFPEGTTWCGLGYGPFRPAMFQAAIDAARPVQPLCLTYRHRDGSASTVPAYIGDDTLWSSICRMVTARRTVVHVHVDSLQLPGADRRELAQRCQVAVSTFETAALMPSWLSETTSLTPRRPRRASLRRKAVQKVSASEGPISMPSTSRLPSLLTPTATMTATETIRPAWSEFCRPDYAAGQQRYVAACGPAACPGAERAATRDRHR